MRECHTPQCEPNNLCSYKRLAYSAHVLSSTFYEHIDYIIISFVKIGSAFDLQNIAYLSYFFQYCIFNSSQKNNEQYKIIY